MPQGVRRRACERCDRDRTERGCSGVVRLEGRSEQKERHDHDPAPDAEERTEDAGDQSDRNRRPKGSPLTRTILGLGPGRSGLDSAVYPREMVARVLVAATSVAVALSLAGSAASAGDAAGSTSVYRLRADPRLCPSPQCGGFWASRVNSTLSVCLGGRQLPSCYAAEVGLSAFPKHSRASIRSAVATGRALIGGSFARYSPAGFPQLAKLVAVSAWLALGSGGKTGTVPQRRRHGCALRTRTVLLASRHPRQRHPLVSALGCRPLRQRRTRSSARTRAQRARARRHPRRRCRTGDSKASGRRRSHACSRRRSGSLPDPWSSGRSGKYSHASRGCKHIAGRCPRSRPYLLV